MRKLWVVKQKQKEYIWPAMAEDITTKRKKRQKGEKKEEEQEDKLKKKEVY